MIVDGLTTSLKSDNDSETLLSLKGKLYEG